ncbi:MAG: hypothetical protein WAM55_01190 [Methylovirgula sp.]|jgi:hypothetical protein
MYAKIHERIESLRRHELDLLEECVQVDASPARLEDLPAMLALARGAVPGVAVESAAVERVYRSNPECIFPFRCGRQIVAGIAFLYLNDDGLDRLLLDEVNFADPDPAILTPFGEAPAALYVWALVARGRAAGGIANVSLRLREQPYALADYYAQPASRGGARLLAQLGFQPENSFQRSLWIYRRLRNRVTRQPAEAFCCVA